MDAILLGNLLAWGLQVTVVVVAAAIVAKVMAIDAAAVRHNWWRGVLLVCLALPFLQSWQPAGAASLLVGSVADIEVAGAGPELPGTAALAMPTARATWSAPMVVALALAAGALVRLAWLAAGLTRLRRLRRGGRPAVLSGSCAEIGALAPAGTRIHCLHSVGQPVTFGLWRPVVLLPATWQTLSPALQRAILAHELWHVRRRDWAWIMAEEGVRALLWFHPAIWWLISRIQSSREEVVDELTVLQTNARRNYVEALLLFAEQPPLFPAAPFARRRHLFTRMLLISKEAAMSSRRIVLSCAGSLAVIALSSSYGAAAFPLTAVAEATAPNVQAPVRDPRVGEVRPATSRELELQRILASGAPDPTTFVELARLQEQRQALGEAEATLFALRRAQPANADAEGELVAHYRRTGQFDKAVKVLEDRASREPWSPQAHHIVATYLFEKVSKDATLGPIERMSYLRRGVAAADRALAVQPDFAEAMIYKSLLLRLQAAGETDLATQRSTLAEADELRNRAQQRRAETRQVTRDANGAPPPPPPPPPPPSSNQEQLAAMVGTKTPLRVGGNIKTPIKIKDVRPIYPPIAQDSRVQGVVIMEVLLDDAGDVVDARVVRSIPLLDEAALDAVRQWKFLPTLLNGEATPVIMTVTVNFTMQ